MPRVPSLQSDSLLTHLQAKSGLKGVQNFVMYKVLFYLFILFIANIFISESMYESILRSYRGFWTHKPTEQINMQTAPLVGHMRVSLVHESPRSHINTEHYSSSALNTSHQPFITFVPWTDTCVYLAHRPPHPQLALPMSPSQCTDIPKWWGPHSLEPVPRGAGRAGKGAGHFRRVIPDA